MRVKDSRMNKTETGSSLPAEKRKQDTATEWKDTETKETETGRKSRENRKCLKNKDTRSLCLALCLALVISLSGSPVFAESSSSLTGTSAAGSFEDLAMMIGDGVDSRILSRIDPEAVYVSSTLTSAKAKELQSALDTMMEELIGRYDLDEKTTGICIQTVDGKVSYSLNPDVQYLAASLYKLPLAVLWYDRLEKDPGPDALMYTFDMYEDISVIASLYAPGTLIPLEEILRQVILTSDNTAGHILFENMGGWLEYCKAAAARWPEHCNEKLYISMENTVSAGFMNDVVLELARRPHQYEKLIADMKASQPDQYLNELTRKPVAQKYGAYGGQLNSSGLDLDVQYPYVITVMTDDVQSQPFMCELARRVQDLFDPDAADGVGKAKEDSSDF